MDNWSIWYNRNVLKVPQRSFDEIDAAAEREGCALKNHRISRTNAHRQKPKTLICNARTLDIAYAHYVHNYNRKSVSEQTRREAEVEQIFDSI